MKISYRIAEVDKKWIRENIRKPGWQRKIYPARVNFFVNHIKNETFKRELFTVAKDDRDGKMILLDGQHRLEAIKKADVKIKMDMKIYEGLNEEEMMEEYNIAQDVKHPRIIDDIRLYIGKNDVLDSFLDERIFPINVSEGGGLNAIRIDRFLNTYKNGTRMAMTRNNLSRKNLKEFLANLTTENFVLMKDFCSFYKTCFGDPFHDNWLYKNMIMFTIMKFWIKNKDEFSKEEMIKAFKPIIRSGSIQQDSLGVDIATQSSLSHKILRLINKGRSKNIFKKYWEEDVRGKEK